jgi:hypothetical protein
LLDRSRDRYSDTFDSSQKKAILHEIVSTVLEKGRFLKRGDANRWTTVTAEKALQKTAHAIQYRMRKKRSGGPDPRAKMKSKIPHVPQLLAPHPQLAPFYPVAAHSQASWDMYYQWMAQCHVQFWQSLSPEARGWHSDNAMVNMPMRSKTSADADGAKKKFSDDSHPGAC